MHAHKKSDHKILISAATLQKRISALAKQINADYADLSEPLVCIGVLKGSIFFLVDLLKQVTVPLVIDFLQTSSYRSGSEPGEVRIRKDIDVAIRGRHVLLIEDIVDTGFTLKTILELFRFRGAASVKLCAMLDKAEAREIEVPVDYRGFEIDDIFVIGYGLDFDERYRELPYIGVYADSAGTNS
ncbi:MAG: hypoxanthine phosphoribosyltransferase [Acidobacteriota bacterium]|nr:hypoxanthine phosphoribosyltransferase [Acidobacteriota bacterium]